MNAFDDTDWSRYLLGACSSGDSLRAAVVRNAAQVKELRGRIAELEAGEVRTEWGIRYFSDTEAVRVSPWTDEDAARFRCHGAPSLVLVYRETRTTVGPWTDADPTTPEKT